MENSNRIYQLNRNLKLLIEESKNENLSIVNRTSINARIYKIKEELMKENELK